MTPADEGLAAVKADSRNIAGLWFVTLPTPDSELCDILFYSTWERLGYQFLGGLNLIEIVGAYQWKPDAESHAERMIWARDATKVATA